VATTQSPLEIETERAFALRYLGTNGDEFHWDMIRLAFSSVADTAIIPLQDILGLDSSARMNVPGTCGGNWGWRFQKGQIDERTTARLAELTAVYNRWNGAIPEGKDPRKNSRRPTGRSPAAGSSS
jgi:4-alpha-glucanotransferase